MKDPDQKLIALSRKGDKTAFGELVKRHYDMVYGLAYGILHSREAALDIAQAVFLKVFKNLRQFEGKSKFKTWIYRVAANAALDETRRKKPSVSMDDTGEGEENYVPQWVDDQSPDPRKRVAEGELRDQLEALLEHLSPEHRAVLVMREWQGLSYEEIAEALKIEAGTVMSRLFYARKKLTQLIEEKADYLKEEIR